MNQTAQERLNEALLYALREGCFHPVPRPPADAPIAAWIQWGAMRNLHEAMAEFYRPRRKRAA
jgi:hypothetical protein